MIQLTATLTFANFDVFKIINNNLGTYWAISQAIT